MLKKTTDIDKILKIDSECFENSKYTRKMYEDMLATCEFYLICEDVLNNNQEEEIGFIIIQNIELECELIKIAIKKIYQNEGYGYAAMNQVIEQVNFNKFYLEVKEDNIPAMSLYKKLGFKLLYTRDNYYSDGKDAVVMVYEKKAKVMN